MHKKMTCPGNGIYVVQGEMAILLTAMRRGYRWSSNAHQDEEQDSLIRSFTDLKDALNQVSDLQELDANHFLGPFLEVIRSEETTGPVTGLALAAVNKFLSYGLVDANSETVATTVENVADAVTHARFVGTDQASDAAVLVKILQVLRTLMLSPEGAMLTNEKVCEIMLSFFRICFEVRLSELLRRSAEHCLKDMVQLLFSRLPQFAEDLRMPINIKKLKMRAGSMDPSRSKRKKRKSIGRIAQKPMEEKTFITTEAKVSTQDLCVVPSEELVSPVEKLSLSAHLHASHLATTPVTPAGNIVDMQGAIHQGTPQSPDEQIPLPDSEYPTPCVVITVESEDTESVLSSKACSVEDVSVTEEMGQEEVRQDERGPERQQEAESTSLESSQETKRDYVNPHGVRFMTSEGEQGLQPPVPFGVACVRELLRFLISLSNPLDKQNTESMTHLGLTLLTVALEVGADSIGKFSSLLSLVKDEMCRNLFSLLANERLSIFAADLQVLFLLFEALRTHLKFQLQVYLTKLTEIIVSDSPRITYEHREIALDSVVQLWRIPGLVTELYLNYDCDLYCPNLFEDLTKLLSKNAFPVSGLYNTHLLSLDALLTIIDSIEAHCNSRIVNQGQEERKLEEGRTLRGSMPAASHPARQGRQRVSDNIPSHEQLMAIKRRKKLLSTGTEHFNAKPKKGITFLQEQRLLSTPLDPQEVVPFLRENPGLEKKMIGEFISNRGNLQVLDCFVKSFDFTDTRIDEALRLYLETFRLPGESPLISLIMEQFAEHWHRCNGEPFANADAAFTLAYAVIMLNVDQHNHNVKRQNNPMTVDEFKRNLKQVNGGQDFDQDMLDDIYNAIKTEEIVMPAEQSGLVKENYLWKVLLRRGASKDGIFVHAPDGLLDHDLFSLIWGPTVAALSFVFDKSNDTAIYQKAIAGFRKCAMISAHYGMSNDFDNLVISLCKFTTLLSSSESNESLTLQFGASAKAQLAATTVFNLAHRHGDILRDGWRNVLECVLQLYRCKLLPKALIEAEDFISQNGKIPLMREEMPSQKTETGLLSSLYSYIALAASEPSSQKSPSPENLQHVQVAQQCVQGCQLEHLITESKFLRLDSLQELVKALIFASHGPDAHVSSGVVYDEDAAVFFLEFLLKVIIQNRDRVPTLWPGVRDHMYSLMMGDVACEHHFLAERSIVGLLRLAIGLMRREDMSLEILQSLRMLLLVKQATLFRVSRQIAYGLYELLKTSAANIHTNADWTIIFTLLECVGAGAPSPKPIIDTNTTDLGEQTAKSDGELGRDDDSGLGMERGYTSDSELTRLTSRQQASGSSPELSPNNGGGWILVGREGDIQPFQVRSLPSNQFSIVHERDLWAHDGFALVKCCESLAFLVRDVAHITPYNFEACVHCIRTFVEAGLNTVEKREPKKPTGSKETKARKKLGVRRKEDKPRSPQNPYDADESDSEEYPSSYHQVSIQLLDLMHTLHTRTAQIFHWWAKENPDTEFTSLWTQGWCPLLQGIARLCCDSRRQVRTSAITYLQRALLVHDLQTLSAPEWESCFNKVLFPLLLKLLSPINPQDQSGVEETRMRAATVLSKVFLHHLTPLLSLPTFTALWLTILDFMDKYMHVDRSDLLYEAIPESLKNMLLVMDSARVFSAGDNTGGYSQLWTITWDRINTFLPCLKNELFKTHPPEAQARPAETNQQEPRTGQQESDELQQDCSDLREHNAERDEGVVLVEQPNSNYPLIGQPEKSVGRDSPAVILIQQPTLGYVHISQQMATTSIESLLHHSTAIPSHSDMVTQAAALPHPPLYLQSFNPTPDRGSAGVTIPSHYFYQDLPPGQHPPHLFPVGSGNSSMLLLNPDLMEGTTLPILSPPGTTSDT